MGAEDLKINMDEVVGQRDILFVCIDSLRYDIALQEQETGGTPVLNRYGAWRKCQAPGNFTYPSHQAMFAGFLPVDEGISDMKQREKLFFSEDIGMGRKAPPGAYTFPRATWIEALAVEGYETICIGGVSFFDKRTELGRVLPSCFRQSYWHPSFGCCVKESAAHQVDMAVRKIGQIADNQRVMLYINFSAIHYPNYFYLEEETNSGQAMQERREASHSRRDSVEAHAAALRYVDRELERLFDAFCGRGGAFVICCSDHGTCYGEDGIWYHGVNHPLVNTVPYKHFFLPGGATG